jgi:EmrB/QacA subfamily drug resistance transporter
MPDQQRLEPALIKVGVVVVLGTIMSILDTTIVAVALHTLSGDFNVDFSTVQWVTTGYLLSLAVVIPVSGWAIHRIGAKPVYMVSLAFFVVGSILCGFAWSATSLIFFRVLQGLGGGMIMPVGQSIMARAAGPHRMGRVMGIIGVPQLLGPILGPVIGGVIVSNTSWRWIFFVNVPIGILALWLAKDFLPRSERDNQHRFDLLGFLLLSPGLALLVYGLSQVADQGGFRGASVWDSIVAGVVLIVLFVLRSTKALEPLIDMRLFKDRTFSVAAIGIFLTGATLYGTMFLLPLYYQVDRGDAAWKAGLMMAPQGIGAAMVMRFAGSLSDRRGPRYVAVFGMALLALGTFFYTSVTATSSYFFLGLALFVRGIGLGFGMMPVFAASYRNLTHQNVPKATSATNIIRQIGGSLGVAVFAVVLQTQIAQRFPRTGAQLEAGLVTPTMNDLQRIAAAFGHSFWWSFGTCVIAIAPAFFLPNEGIAKRDGAAAIAQPAAD